MTEIRKGNKAIQKFAGMIFYGQYYKDYYESETFQVLESKSYTERNLKNLKKKYGF